MPRASTNERHRAPEAIDPPRLVWTVQETASACAVSPALVTRAIQEGKLRACVFGPQTIRVLPEDALEWVHSHRTGARPVSKEVSKEIPKEIPKEEKKPGKKKAPKKKGADPVSEQGEGGLDDLDWVLDA